MSLASDKKSISRLVQICILKKLKYVVISPGSRNAPLTLSFAENDAFECLNIPDERSAAFFALGMAQKLKAPVILCCTSGSAALNYAPAIAEAYYQKIPLLVITADRPIEWIDQRAGQTIRQQNIYEKYIKRSFQIIQEAEDENHLWYNDRIVNEAIIETLSGNPGPVHVNVPLMEPLYNLVKASDADTPKIVEYTANTAALSSLANKDLIRKWNAHSSVLVIVGQGDYNKEFNDAIDQIAKLEHVVVLTETTSNIDSASVLPSIDRVIDSIEEASYPDFTPELIISVGAAIVSKKIRFMLRKMEVKSHWQIHPYDRIVDTYKALTDLIAAEPAPVLQMLASEKNRQDKTAFKSIWIQRELKTRQAHDNFLQEIPWCDLLVMSKILEAIPSGALHLASSTPVRYNQLFSPRADLTYFCNRGVSGIDGCTSTAAGYAYLDEDLVTLITGDIAFFYDSNGLWHHHLKSNLRIILINNGGGNIFRYVKGPETTNYLEQHFEATHQTSARGVASAYGVSYLHANDLKSLQNGLKDLYSPSICKPTILEVETPGDSNIDVLKSYFDYLTKNVES